ncbi:U6 small nuclear RNA (adenine-(43)-N(6))-methyltransferase [Tribolium madens]|uniref:U6 small nuclear RNA (adenine-(43)-N(6))-methyltransferase n=1 Tax=Tribolium madens TaxID=41895 RepID=UPI001CF72A79|nr:U6 small nuclear RNA (adenine-(43)-N(6))-methyltransferase [Tribolium madens]
MSMNQYMHPRNIYKQPPNFKQLAIEYPEFRKYTTQDVSGKVTIDFKNVEALRALTCTLLKKDFGLNVEIPANKLIPTIPLRLNYILWIEDLLDLAGKPENVRGIDIGTGASCIYPLLAAKKSPWSMIATEIDPESIKYATNNVKSNNLEALITVVEVKKDSLLDEVLQKHLGDFNFCMCNPPFFSTTQELHPFFKARKQNRPHPKNAFCASVDEVVATGGEVEYISRLINESKTWGLRVTIYTTMVGHKSSLPPLKKLIREIGVVSFKQTEFCQGHTTRWGLAWTFHDIDLTKIPDSLVAAKQKLTKPLLYQVPKTDDSEYKVSFICERLVKIFKQLQMDFQEIKHVKNLVEYVIVAYSDTWSHQRRKRREKLRLSDEMKKCGNNNLDSPERNEVCEKLAELGVNGSPSNKRALDEDCGFYNAKKRKTELDECNSEKIYLKAKISVAKIEDCIGLELLFFEGKGTKEALHQILQFVKNNLMKDEL